MRVIPLTEQERKALIRLGKQLKEVKAAIRVRVILALDAGYSIKETARLFLLDEDTITRWKNKFEKRQTLSDWLEEDHHGYDGKLTNEQKGKVVEFVTTQVITDSQEIVRYIQREFAIQYTISGVTKLLHRLGFVYKQVVEIPGKLDEAKQREFLQEYECLKENKRENEVILFGDGVHPTHNIQKTKAWIQRGEEKQIKTNTGRKRLNINGVLEPEMLRVITHFSETLNAQTTIAFFQKIQEAYPEKQKITLIIDNARYYKNKEVTAYVNRPECRITLKFLPPYSPNLNFIERLWKYLKKYVIGVTYREKFKEFEEDIHAFFDNIHVYEDTLRPFIGSTLHLIKLAS